MGGGDEGEGGRCTDAPREATSAHQRESERVDRFDEDFLKQRDQVHFDLPLSCIGFSSSTREGRTPLNQHHLLWLCIHVCFHA